MSNLRTATPVNSENLFGNAAASATGGSVGEYRKSRVTVGAVEVGDASHACLGELLARLPAVPNLFVLVPGDVVAASVHNIVPAALAKTADKRVRLVNQNQSEASLEAKQAPCDGRLTPDLVRHVEAWMDRRSSRAVQDHLDAGQCIVFVQVSNSEEETSAYRIVGRYCAGGVQLHDLPV